MVRFLIVDYGGYKLSYNLIKRILKPRPAPAPSFCPTICQRLHAKAIAKRPAVVISYLTYLFICDVLTARRRQTAFDIRRDLEPAGRNGASQDRVSQIRKAGTA
jgi:hypothetical protein